MISEVCGPSIGDLLNYCGGTFTLKTTLMILYQMITRFENLHKKGIVHCDIKPENIIMGLKRLSHVAYLIDYGISNFWLNKKGEHIDLQSDCSLIGTVRYVSVNSHLGFELTRRDDLIGLGYLVY